MTDDTTAKPPSPAVRQRERPKRPKGASGPAPSPTSDEPYEVGYGKPPKHAQFQPGQSGNPTGRPKGSKSPLTLLRAELEQKVTLREGNRVTTVTKLEAVLKRVVNDTLGGKASSARLLFPLLHVFEAQDASTPEDRNFSPSDAELLRNVLKGFDDE